MTSLPVSYRPQSHLTLRITPMRRSLFALLTVATLTLTGCGRDNTLPDDGGAAANGAGADSGVFTDRSGGNGGITESPLEAERRRLMSQLVVYFDYDQADILPEFNALLQ